jgi:hypothetical protein
MTGSNRARTVSPTNRGAGPEENWRRAEDFSQADLNAVQISLAS